MLAGSKLPSKNIQTKISNHFVKQQINNKAGVSNRKKEKFSKITCK
jgi:hypothetical protein